LTVPALTSGPASDDAADDAAKLRRKRLSRADQAEVARLYGQTDTSAADIRQQFGIGDSTLYRIVQRNGLTLRGRVGSTARKPREARPATRRTAGRGTSPRRARGSATHALRLPQASAATLPAPTPVVDGSSRRTYRVRFDALIRARDVSDALRQAAGLGAQEVVAITQQD